MYFDILFSKSFGDELHAAAAVRIDYTLII